MAIGDDAKITVTAKTRILKYAEGADPAVDQPFEVVEKTSTFVGDQALQVLNQYGILKEGVTNGND